jgi:vacuolar iron transporter family protein
MPQTRHVERHFTAKDFVRDVVIGMSDGLTVPFALAAGLTGAVSSAGVIVTAGLAEVAAGAIAMGLGGYLAARSDREHYVNERAREWKEVREIPDEERKEVREVFREFGLADEDIEPILQAFQKKPAQWVNFMMRFELGLEKPEPGRDLRSAAMGISTLLAAKRLILMVSGTQKKDILQQAMKGPITSDVPASFLQTHDNLMVLADFDY